MSDITVEHLELEVQSNANSAVTGIDALSASLSKLKNAVKGGVGLNSVANQVRNLNTALQGMDGSSADKIDKLANSLSKLKDLGSIKISSSIGNQLKNIGNTASSLNGADFSGIGKLADALQPLNSIGKASGLQSAITQLKKLPQLAQTLNDVNWAAFTSQLQQLSNALAPLANQLNTVSAAFARMPANIQQTVAVTKAIPSANNKAAASYINLWAKARLAYNAVRTGASVIASWISESNDYIENQNLFTVSMGKYAEEAQRYAEQASAAMGIDPSEWMRAQGAFNTIITGFGVAGDKASVMSKNLTQLSYDLSSLWNKPVAEAMQKVQSGIAGELEPLRAWGYDLSVARLQQEALNLGIEKSVSDMTQAEKSQLRYHAMLTQVTVAQGDMARTLDEPANQLRILRAQVTQCARALGDIFLPMLTSVLPYLIALAKAVRIVASTIAGLFGGFRGEAGFASGISAGADVVEELAGGIENAEDGLGGAAENAKKLKNALLGIDELNVISPPDATGGGGGNVSGGIGGGLDIDPIEYNFFDEAVGEKVSKILEQWKPTIDWIENHLDDIFKTAVVIGTAIAAWKVSQSLLTFIEWFGKLKSKFLQFGIGFKIVGLGLFLDSWNTIKEAIEDILTNGVNLTNATKLISGFAEGLGAAFLAFGNTKWGGAMLILSGLTSIISAISDMLDNGVNLENATVFIKNIGLLLSGIGLAFKNVELGGIGLVISGISLIVQNLKDLVNAFNTGDFSNVNWVEVAAGALMFIGGLILVFGKINKLKNKISAGETAATLTQTSTSVGQLDTTMSTGLSPKLSSLAKNLGLGLVIITEVAASALLIVGAIILLGMALEQVGIAWQPVIDNWESVAAAMTVGIAILGVVGVLTALLGNVGTPLIVNIALGAAILAEIGLAAGLFLAEIWAIGWGLDQIGQAWQPVLDNGETIAIAIGLGTAILVAIAAVTGLLGVATTASGGLLPLAIGLGTALLLELGVATGLFLVEIWAIGKGLDEIGQAWQPVLDNGDTISKGIERGTELLIGIGVVTAALGAATVASVGLLPLAIGLGTELLLDLSDATILFTDSVADVADEMSNRLAPSLENLNAKLPGLSENMEAFTDYMREFAGHIVSYSKDSAISAIAATVDTIIGWFTKDPLEKLRNDVAKTYDQATGLNEKLNVAVPELEMAKDLIERYTGAVSEIERLLDAQGSVSLASGAFVDMKAVGQSLVTGFVEGIQSRAGDFVNAGKKMVGDFKDAVSDTKDTAVDFRVALKKNGWTTIRNWIGTIPVLSQGISLQKSGWASVKAWIGNLPALNQGIALIKSGWTTVENWVGSHTVDVSISLSKSGWYSLSAWIGDRVSVGVSLYKNGWTSIKSFFGLPTGAYRTGNGFALFAQGGYISGGKSGFWKSIPMYANGAANAGLHGSMFVAGENGAEMVGHINGQTEVLNRSQISIAMKSAVVAGMSQFTGYWRNMNSQMAICANAVIRSILVSSDVMAASLAEADGYDLTSTLAQSVYEDSQNAYSRSRDDESLSRSMRDFYTEYVEPTLKEIASDTKRQADKNEQTIVQVGSRTITDTVETQKKANGYSFIR